jgi:hypothetical protein
MRKNGCEAVHQGGLLCGDRMAIADLLVLIPNFAPVCALANLF